jgi:hypothetical protein
MFQRRRDGRPTKIASPRYSTCAAILTVAVLALALAPAFALAEGQSPEEVARVGLDLVSKRDWPAYAHLMHPEALRSMKQMFRPIVEADTKGEAAQGLFGVAGIGDYDAASDSALFCSLMVNLMKIAPTMVEAVKNAQYTVIGSVPEGQDLVHVVYRVRTAAEDVQVTKVSAISLRRHGETWRFLLSGNMEGLVSALQKAHG